MRQQELPTVWREYFTTKDAKEHKVMNANEASQAVLDAAMKVHSSLGPGLLEEAYKVCLAQELRSDNIDVATEVGLPVIYDGVTLDVGYRIDLLVEKQLIVELKAVSDLLPIHKAQILTYLKLAWSQKKGYLSQKSRLPGESVDLIL